MKNEMLSRALAGLMLLPTVGTMMFTGPGRPVVLTESGVNRCVIVYDESDGFAAKSAAQKLKNACKSAVGVDPAVITESGDPYAALSSAFEPSLIRIGTRTPDASLRVNDYRLAVEDGVLYIDAGSADVLSVAGADAAKRFGTFADGKTLTIPASFSYTYTAPYEIDRVTLPGGPLSDYTVTYIDDAAKGTAEEFAATVTEKTGYVLPVEKDDGREKAVVFGKKAGMERTACGVSSEGSRLYVAASTGEGLRRASSYLTDKLTEGGTKTVELNDLSYTDTLTKPSDYTAYIKARNGLANTLVRLEKDKELRVAYFGGSVTVGYGATNPASLSWRARTTTWLKENFPDATITEINAAIGATGSTLGKYRVERDVIAEKPDLVFVEFAINDCYNGETSDSAGENAESIVRQIRRANPASDIVFVYTIDSSRTTVDLFPTAAAHDKICEAYGLPSLRAGKAICDKNKLANAGSPGWKDYFIDIVHATDKGYEAYAACVTELLANELLFNEPTTEVTERPLDAPVFKGADDALTYHPVTEADLSLAEGFTYSSGTAISLALTPYNGALTANDPKATLTIPFEGSELWLFLNFNAGMLKFDVDGKKSTFTRFNTNNPVCVAKGLDKGAHIAKINFAFTDKNTKSGSVVSYMYR